ncbi:Arm DNA-binding domain-containing protein [Pseudanabaena sp. PCC 6802]|uniref:Arm DNA-binding domain-containing protein n=1 Tax=Pseudanabaena sp. PCC 6802 TaxID=118173 RepID=UPI0008FC124F|nr:DUF3596 domain-containing protein [Pseudanabaena sp. PCC 6802]
MSTVYIEKHDGRLRLRWFHANKRYTLAAGVDDNATGRAIAKQKAAQIELDIAAGYFVNRSCYALIFVTAILPEKHTSTSVPGERSRSSYFPA